MKKKKKKKKNVFGAIPKLVSRAMDPNQVSVYEGKQLLHKTRDAQPHQIPELGSRPPPRASFSSS